MDVGREPMWRVSKVTLLHIKSKTATTFFPAHAQHLWQARAAYPSAWALLLVPGQLLPSTPPPATCTYTIRITAAPTSDPLKVAGMKAVLHSCGGACSCSVPLSPSKANPAVRKLRAGQTAEFNGTGNIIADAQTVSLMSDQGVPPRTRLRQRQATATFACGTLIVVTCEYFACWLPYVCAHSSTHQ